MGYILNIVVVFGVIIGMVLSEPRVCYSCANNSTCADPVNTTNIGIIDCLQSSVAINSTAVCVKVTSSGDSTNSGVTVERSCVPQTYNDTDICTFAKQTLKDYNVTVLSCSTCSSNLCNSSTRTPISLLFVIISIFIVVLSYS